MDKNWAQYNRENALKERDDKILAGVAAWPKDQPIPQSAVSPVDKKFPLGTHISEMRCGRGNYSNVIEAVREINPIALMTRDEKIIAGVKAWPKNKPIPCEAVSPVDETFPLGVHILDMRNGRGDYSNVIEAVRDINPNVLKTKEDLRNDRDEKIIAGVKVWPKDKPIPKNAVSPGDEPFQLGMHILRMRNGDPSYPSELKEEINEINPNALKTKKDLLKDRDEKIIAGVKVWPKDKPIPGSAVSPVDETFPLGMHISEMKKNRSPDSYSDVREQVREINPLALQSSKSKEAGEE